MKVVLSGGVLLLDVCEYFLLVHGGFLLFVNKIISPLDTSLEFVRGVGRSGFVVFYVLCTVFFNMLQIHLIKNSSFHLSA